MNSSEIVKLNLILLNLGDPDHVVIGTIVDETQNEVMLNMPILLKTQFDVHNARVGAAVQRYMGFSEGPIAVRKDKIVAMSKPAKHMIEFYKDFLYTMTEEEVYKYEMRVLQAVDPADEVEESKEDATIVVQPTSTRH